MSDIVTFFIKAMIIGLVSELLAFFAPIGDNFKAKKEAKGIFKVWLSELIIA